MESQLISCSKWKGMQIRIVSKHLICMRQIHMQMLGWQMSVLLHSHKRLGEEIRLSHYLKGVKPNGTLHLFGNLVQSFFGDFLFVTYIQLNKALQSHQSGVSKSWEPLRSLQHISGLESLIWSKLEYGVKIVADDSEDRDWSHILHLSCSVDKWNGSLLLVLTDA